MILSHGYTTIALYYLIGSTEAIWLNCPKNIAVETDKGSATGKVFLPEPIFFYDETTRTKILSKRVQDDSHQVCHRYSSALCFPIGTHKIRYRAPNVDTLCEFNVIVEDKEAPKFLNCPAPESERTTPGLSKTISFPIHLKAVDNSLGPVNIRALNGAKGFSSNGHLKMQERLALGTHKRSYKAVDQSGNESECTFSVTVSKPLHLRNMESKSEPLENVLRLRPSDFEGSDKSIDLVDDNMLSDSRRREKSVDLNLDTRGRRRTRGLKRFEEDSNGRCGFLCRAGPIGTWVRRAYDFYNTTAVPLANASGVSGLSASEKRGLAEVSDIHRVRRASKPILGAPFRRLVSVRRSERQIDSDNEKQKIRGLEKRGRKFKVDKHETDKLETDKIQTDNQVIGGKSTSGKSRKFSGKKTEKKLNNATSHGKDEEKQGKSPENVESHAAKDARARLIEEYVARKMAAESRNRLLREKKRDWYLSEDGHAARKGASDGISLMKAQETFEREFGDFGDLDYSADIISGLASLYVRPDKYLPRGIKVSEWKRRLGELIDTIPDIETNYSPNKRLEADEKAKVNEFLNRLPCLWMDLTFDDELITNLLNDVGQLVDSLLSSPGPEDPLDYFFKHTTLNIHQECISGIIESLDDGMYDIIMERLSNVIFKFGGTTTTKIYFKNLLQFDVNHRLDDGVDEIDFTNFSSPNESIEPSDPFIEGLSAEATTSEASHFGDSLERPFFDALLDNSSEALSGLGVEPVKHAEEAHHKEFERPVSSDFVNSAKARSNFSDLVDAIVDPSRRKVVWRNPGNNTCGVSSAKLRVASDFSITNRHASDIPKFNVSTGLKQILPKVAYQQNVHHNALNTTKINDLPVHSQTSLNNNLPIHDPSSKFRTHFVELDDLASGEHITPENTTRPTYNSVPSELLDDLQDEFTIVSIADKPRGTIERSRDVKNLRDILENSRDIVEKPQAVVVESLDVVEKPHDTVEKPRDVVESLDVFERPHDVADDSTTKCRTDSQKTIHSIDVTESVKSKDKGSGEIVEKTDSRTSETKSKRSSTADENVTQSSESDKVTMSNAREINKTSSMSSNENTSEINTVCEKAFATAKQEEPDTAKEHNAAAKKKSPIHTNDDTVNRNENTLEKKAGDEKATATDKKIKCGDGDDKAREYGSCLDISSRIGLAVSARSSEKNANGEKRTKEDKKTISVEKKFKTRRRVHLEDDNLRGAIQSQTDGLYPSSIEPAKNKKVTSVLQNFSNTNDRDDVKKNPKEHDSVWNDKLVDTSIKGLSALGDSETPPNEFRDTTVDDWSEEANGKFFPMNTLIRYAMGDRQKAGRQVEGTWPLKTASFILSPFLGQKRNLKEEKNRNSILQEFGFPHTKYQEKYNLEFITNPSNVGSRSETEHEAPRSNLLSVTLASVDDRPLSEPEDELQDASPIKKADLWDGKGPHIRGKSAMRGFELEGTTDSEDYVSQFESSKEKTVDNRPAGEQHEYEDRDRKCNGRRDAGRKEAGRRDAGKRDAAKRAVGYRNGKNRYAGKRETGNRDVVRKDMVRRERERKEKRTKEGRENQRREHDKTEDERREHHKTEERREHDKTEEERREHNTSETEKRSGLNGHHVEDKENSTDVQSTKDAQDAKNSEEDTKRAKGITYEKQGGRAIEFMRKVTHDDNLPPWSRPRNSEEYYAPSDKKVGSTRGIPPKLGEFDSRSLVISNEQMTNDNSMSFDSMQQSWDMPETVDSPPPDDGAPGSQLFNWGPLNALSQFFNTNYSEIFHKNRFDKNGHGTVNDRPRREVDQEWEHRHEFRDPNIEYYPNFSQERQVQFDQNIPYTERNYQDKRDNEFVTNTKRDGVVRDFRPMSTQPNYNLSRNDTGYRFPRESVFEESQIRVKTRPLEMNPNNIAYSDALYEYPAYEPQRPWQDQANNRIQPQRNYQYNQNMFKTQEHRYDYGPHAEQYPPRPHNHYHDPAYHTFQKPHGPSLTSSVRNIAPFDFQSLKPLIASVTARVNHNFLKNPQIIVDRPTNQAYYNQSH